MIIENKPFSWAEILSESLQFLRENPIYFTPYLILFFFQNSLNNFFIAPHVKEEIEIIELVSQFAPFFISFICLQTLGFIVMIVIIKFKKIDNQESVKIEKGLSLILSSIPKVFSICIFIFSGCLFILYFLSFIGQLIPIFNYIGSVLAFGMLLIGFVFIQFFIIDVLLNQHSIQYTAMVVLSSLINQKTYFVRWIMFFFCYLIGMLFLMVVMKSGGELLLTLIGGIIESLLGALVTVVTVLFYHSVSSLDQKNNDHSIKPHDRN